MDKLHELQRRISLNLKVDWQLLSRFQTIFIKSIINHYVSHPTIISHLLKNKNFKQFHSYDNATVLKGHWWKEFNWTCLILPKLQAWPLKTKSLMFCCSINSCAKFYTIPDSSCMKKNIQNIYINIYIFEKIISWVK